MPFTLVIPFLTFTLRKSVQRMETHPFRFMEKMLFHQQTTVQALKAMLQTGIE